MKATIAIDWSSRVVYSIEEALDNIEVSTFEDWLNENYESSEVWDLDEEKRRQILEDYEEYVNDEKERTLAYDYEIMTIDV